jgi:hypothetical protein
VSAAPEEPVDRLVEIRAMLAAQMKEVRELRSDVNALGWMGLIIILLLAGQCS